MIPDAAPVPAPFSRRRSTFLCSVVVSRVCFATLMVAACDATSRLDDTLGVQSAARWEWHGRIVVTQDSTLTVTRLSIDTAHGGGDVGLARYDFNPAVGEGDEYSITLALDLGRAHDLRQNVPYALGSDGTAMRAWATVSCFCPPLKPDSVRGTFRMATRGLRQIAGRVDATLYFTEWNDAARHVTYPLHQRIDLVK